MERYSLDKKIPSCFVSKKLIEQLERYLKERLLKKMKGILSLDEKYKFEYKLYLKDNLGEEQLVSIDEYHRDKFSNDINKISLDYSINYSDLKISINFSKDYYFSDLKINLHCNGATEVTLGILNEINEIIKESGTIHFVFYNKFAWSIYCIWFLSIFLDWISFSYSRELRDFIFFLGIAYFLARQISPYSSFETVNKGKQDKVVSWFLNGMASVFFFGVIATAIRNVLF
jgi:hypothetical protein